MISATLSYEKVLCRCVTTVAVHHLQPHFTLSSESGLCLAKKVKVDCYDGKLDIQLLLPALRLCVW